MSAARRSSPTTRKILRASSASSASATLSRGRASSVSQRLERPRRGQAVNTFLEKGVCSKTLLRLKRAYQTEGRDVMRLETVQQRVAITNFARGGLEKSRKDVEGGRFTGTVWANEGDDLSL